MSFFILPSLIGPRTLRGRCRLSERVSFSNLSTLKYCTTSEITSNRKGIVRPRKACMEIEMKNPSKLSRQALIEIVESIRDRMYLDINPPDYPDEALRDVDVWNPDKEVCGADLVETIDQILASHGLRPGEMRAV